MAAITYLRWSLVVPLVVPLVAVALLFVSRRVIGWMDPGAIEAWTIILLYSLLIGGLPYLVFSTAAFLWSRGKSTRAVVTLSLLAPPLFAVLFFVLWSAFVLIESNEPDALDAALLSGGIYAAFCIGLGYIYVALVYIGFAVLRRLGKVEPLTAPALRANEPGM